MSESADVIKDSVTKASLGPAPIDPADIVSGEPEGSTVMLEAVRRQDPAERRLALHTRNLLSTP